MKDLYTSDQKRKILYLIRRLSELKNGQTLSPQFSDSYPFYPYIDRYGRQNVSSSILKRHFLYIYLQENPQISAKIDLIEVAWQYYFVYGTPNGELFKNNSNFDSIKDNNGLTLLHCTTSLKEIEETGLLFPSGGCLGASIYSVPVRADGRLHNLTKFLLEYELPLSLKMRQATKDKKPGLLAIHLENENFIHSNEESNGVDYLLMGDLLADVYLKFRKSCQNKISKKVFNDVEKQIVYQVRKTARFLNICVDYQIDKISGDEFFRLFNNSLKELPFLGYLYFEVLVEFISLFQNDEASMLYKEQGELYNGNYKKMIFDLCPQLLENFKLILFKPDIKEVCAYLKQKSKDGKIISNFVESEFIMFFKWRFAQYARYKLMSKQKIGSLSNFNNLIRHNPSLVGHLIHREMRMFDIIRPYISRYEKIRAKLIWDEWNKQKIVFPYNSIVPKGEVGINPGYNNLDYKMYYATLDQTTGKIILGKPIQARLAFKLSKPNMSVMRAPL